MFLQGPTGPLFLSRGGPGTPQGKILVRTLLTVLIIWVREVLKRTVVGDWHIGNQSGSHLQIIVLPGC